MSKSAQKIYAKPDAYDLEHAAPEPDVNFFTDLARRHKPKRILEIACGNGRVTIPLARAAKEWDGQVTGCELSAEMLSSARDKDDARLVEWHEGDVREWRSDAPFDLIISPCASLSHLLQLDDQLAAWRTAAVNLRSGGRFVVAEVMANFPVLADSMQVPARTSVELDLDHADSHLGARLLRYRTTRYHAHEQRATVHFFYDKFEGGDDDAPERFVSDYQAHVYFPRELQLLFLATGFEIEDVWGNYDCGPLTHLSRQLIVSGIKP